MSAKLEDIFDLSAYVSSSEDCSITRCCVYTKIFLICVCSKPAGTANQYFFEILGKFLSGKNFFTTKKPGCRVFQIRFLIIAISRI